MKEVQLKIVSQTISPKLVAGLNHVEILIVTSNTELQALYDWADLAIVPLKPNMHASGITVLEEAAICGVPAVATDVGGLRAYFDEDEVFYVPAGDPTALRTRIAAALASPEKLGMAEKAHAKMGRDGLSSFAFVRRHVELSRELCGQPPEAARGVSSTPLTAPAAG
jgi:glycosyltransferase involved in cell wall biosynthesis